MSDAEMQAIAL